VLASKLGGKPFFSTLNAAGKSLAKQARGGQYKHITQNIEVGFNQSVVSPAKDAFHVLARATSFGKPSQKARHEM